MDHSHLVLCSEGGGHLATYYGEDMHTYYKMPRSVEYAIKNFYTRWVDHDRSEIIKSWRREPTKFRHFSFAIYPTNILNNVY